MLEKLKELRDLFEEKEVRCTKKGDKYFECHPALGYRFEGKATAFREAKEALDAIIKELEEEENYNDAEAVVDAVDEIGYNPYTGGFDADV